MHAVNSIEVASTTNSSKAMILFIATSKPYQFFLVSNDMSILSKQESLCQEICASASEHFGKSCLMVKI